MQLLKQQNYRIIYNLTFNVEIGGTVNKITICKFVSSWHKSDWQIQAELLFYYRYNFSIQNTFYDQN